MCLQKCKAERVVFTAEVLFKNFTCLQLISQTELQQMSQRKKKYSLAEIICGSEHKQECSC